ncbi:MAG: T9SS type A sorting domain-containing protein [Cytophagaceae bacterium]
MKHIYLVFLFVAHVSMGQFTLTSSYKYEAGMSYRSYQYYTVDLAPQGSGASQTWNFTGMQEFSRYNSVVQSKSFDLYYPSANIVVKTSHSTPREYYYQPKNNELINWGYKNTEIGDANYSYQDSHKVLQYPMSFGGAEFSDSVKGTILINYMGTSFPGTRKAKVVTSIDGYGSIVLPNSNHDNVIRVKSLLTSKDTFTNPTDGEQVVVSSTVTTYVWYAENVKYPVFTLVYTDITDVPYIGSYTDTLAIENTEVPAGLFSSNKESELINVYPNPAYGKINVSWTAENSANVTFNLTDLSGRKMMSLGSVTVNAGEQNHSFDISGILPGAYLLEIESEGRKGVKRVIIK